MSKEENKKVVPPSAGASRLLPCPFCGGAAEHDALMIGDAGQDNATPHGHFIECQTCLANAGNAETPEEAAEAWNKRTPAAPAPTQGVEVVNAFSDAVEALTKAEYRGAGDMEEEIAPYKAKYEEARANLLAALAAAEGRTA